MKKNVTVASIHTSFHINRNPNEAHEGDVTLNEQIKAIQRFVRWHERQVVVGQQLLKRLADQIPAEPVSEPEPEAVAG